MVTSPASGRTSPTRQRMKVLLPLPLGPSSPVTPGVTSRSRGCRAWWSPNRRVTPRAEIVPGAAAGGGVVLGAGEVGMGMARSGLPYGP